MSVAQDKLSEITGWKALDLDNPELGLIRQEQGEQIKQVNSDMRELFTGSELGLRVLGYLMDWTIKKPAISPYQSERVDLWRAGQDDIVRCILSAIHNSETSGGR